MRTGIREQLINSIPEIGGRCYEPHAAGAKTEKPYIVIRQGVDTEDSPWLGFRRIIEIWPYVEKLSFKLVDDLEKKIKSALEKQILTDINTGEVFSCFHIGTTEDVVDEEWDAITRGLRFAVVAIQPVNANESIANDPWIESLATWSENILGQNWTVYRNVLPLGFQRPAVLWRIEGIHVDHSTRSAFEVRKHIKGHVIGTSPHEELFGATSLIQEMGNSIKIPINLLEKRFMTVENPRVNMDADSLSSGQLKVVMKRITSRPQEEIPLMLEIQSKGNLKG
jgi:hypothetical protein